ncbi:hypothetical protein [Methylocapsa sp. S129]|uniref:hypothetical protein n=1 Tax=Methylocapsa sp. S129 TaxID=1641869 RepID=UPI00131AB3DB|nr:hypothetical protein [Methylocapsa sp. S129]
MTMHAKITTPVAPAALDDVLEAIHQRNVAPGASARRPVPPSPTHHSPSLVIVVPDPVDAIVKVGSEAGLKGGSKLLWTFGVLLLLAA